jgi:predicted hydrocarbon binding protein
MKTTMANNAILSELTYQTNEGALRFEGVRYLLIRPETLASVQGVLEAEIGAEGAGEILYAGGFTGGRLSGRKYKESFGLSDREAVEFMCRMGGEIGWGHFRLVELDAQAQRLVVAVESSPFAEAYNQAGNNGQRSPAGICHLIRGVLGGLGEGIFGVPVHALETQCLANRKPYCQFEVLAR